MRSTLRLARGVLEWGGVRVASWVLTALPEGVQPAELQERRNAVPPSASPETGDEELAGQTGRTAARRRQARFLLVLLLVATERLALGWDQPGTKIIGGLPESQFSWSMPKGDDGDVRLVQASGMDELAHEAHYGAEDGAYVFPVADYRGEAHRRTTFAAVKDLAATGVRVSRMVDGALGHRARPDLIVIATLQVRPSPVSERRRESGEPSEPSLYGRLRTEFIGRLSKWVVATLGALLGTYAIGLGALLLLTWRRGSAALSKSWLLSKAAKLLLAAPGSGRRLLFLGYSRRLAGQPAVVEAAESYFGLPAEYEGVMLPPDPTGDPLHEAMASGLGPQRPIIVFGTGGAGKSTLLARFAHLALSDRLPHTLAGYRPLLIPASYYGGSLIKAVADTLRERDGVMVDEEITRAQLQSGRFLILFDGVSEVATERADALKEILRTARHADYSNNRFMIATRRLEGAAAEVTTFILQPLEPAVISKMLPGYNLGVARENRIRAQLRQFGERSIEPLLFTMILQQGAHERLGTTRTEIYEQYFQRLLRISRDKNLWEGWRDSLETLACHFLVDTGRRGVGLVHETLLDLMAERKLDGKIIESVSARLRRLYHLPVIDELDVLGKLEGAGLLHRGRRWRFAHDTFEEYFAASYLLSYFERKEELPSLAQWLEPSERQREFVGVLSFLREMSDEASRQRLCEMVLPEPWKTGLSVSDEAADHGLAARLSDDRMVPVALGRDRGSRGPGLAGRRGIAPYAVLSLVSLLGSLVLVSGFSQGWLRHQLPMAEPRGTFLYLLLLLLGGVAVAGFLFGALRSLARYRGQRSSGIVEVGAMAVGFGLAILAGWLSRPQIMPETSSPLLLPSRTEMVLDRATRNSFVYHDKALGSMGTKIAEVVALKVENDLAKLTEFFDGTKLPRPLKVYIKALDSTLTGSGGAYHTACRDEHIYVDVKVKPALDTDYTSALIVSQAVDIFGAAQGKGWECGLSNESGLKRALAGELYPTALRGYATAGAWLDSPDRPDLVNNAYRSDMSSVANGCAVLFLNYMHTQLNIPWKKIVQAGGWSLGETYANLGLGKDGFVKFKQLMNLHYPVDRPSGLTTDNPFPL